MVEIKHDEATLVARLNFIAECLPGQKPIFGKNGTLQYIDSKDVISNKLLRHWYHWQDSSTNANDVTLTVRQATEFLLTTSPRHNYYQLIAQLLGKTKLGIAHLRNTLSDHATVKGQLTMALVDIDKAVEMARRRSLLEGKDSEAEAADIQAQQLSAARAIPMASGNNTFQDSDIVASTPPRLVTNTPPHSSAQPPKPPREPEEDRFVVAPPFPPPQQAHPPLPPLLLPSEFVVTNPKQPSSAIAASAAAFCAGSSSRDKIASSSFSAKMSR